MQSQLTSLLGEPGYTQYNQFRREADAEALVNGLNNDLATMRSTPTAEQANGRFMAATKPEIVFDIMDLFRSPDSLNATFQAIVDLSDSHLQEAASFLSPQQLAAYGAAQSNYINSLRTQMNLTRQLVTGGGGK